MRPSELAVQRELFLKGRTGWESGLVYVNAFFVGAVVPYTLALMFAHNARFRWLCLAFFLVYSISFLEKALFLKAMLPIAYLVFQGRLGNVIASIGVLVGMILLLMFVTTAASSLCPAGTPRAGPMSRGLAMADLMSRRLAASASVSLIRSIWRRDTNPPAPWTI